MKQKNSARLVPTRPLSSRDELVAQVLFSCPLPALEERLLLRLLHLANSSAKVGGVSGEQLALSLRVSERAMRSALRTLEDAGVIERRRPHYPQRYERATYHIDVALLRGICKDWWQTAAHASELDSVREQARVAERLLRRAKAQRRSDIDGGPGGTAS